MPPKSKIWTIGHSTHSLEEFLHLLNTFKIKTLVDIRRYPGSNRFPHFNKEELSDSMKKNGIEYIYIEELGGRRKPDPESQNTGWRLPIFRGYADYMETKEFQSAIKKLENKALKKATAFMSSEGIWWSSHRALVSDYLKNKGWQVLHIMNNEKATPHPYTSVAKIIKGTLTYRKDK
jgi:uncharacterized protein (DUF488 family)